uniref:Uncharacterized protein n=1 Tax=Caenorhabditis japonica TaxID=281687 RepID=A0A8R1EFF8_CAEJA
MAVSRIFGASSTQKTQKDGDGWMDGQSVRQAASSTRKSVLFFFCFAFLAYWLFGSPKMRRVLYPISLLSSFSQ